MALVQAEGPFTVSIVNREPHAGRHIVNADDIAKEINALLEVKYCRYCLHMAYACSICRHNVSL